MKYQGGLSNWEVAEHFLLSLLSQLFCIVCHNILGSSRTRSTKTDKCQLNFRFTQDTRMNPEQFPTHFFSGSWEGFWWAFVSMTTVGWVEHLLWGFCLGVKLAGLVTLKWCCLGQFLDFWLVQSLPLEKGTTMPSYGQENRSWNPTFWSSISSGWVDEWMNEWMNDYWMSEWVSEWVSERMGGWMNEWMNQ